MKKTKEVPRWRRKDRAREELIDFMLKRSGISVLEGADAQSIKATREYAMRVIGSCPESKPFVSAMGGPCPVTMGELEDIANHFLYGYEQCLFDLGLCKRQ